MTVLVLTEQVDPTADVVVDLLHQREVPTFRCDTGWFPQCLDVAAELIDGTWSGQIQTALSRLELGTIRSVWYRRPTAFDFPRGMSPAERRHAALEAKLGLGGILWSLSDVLWVNHPAREADLYKPTQLAVAARCGLRVPDTLVTNRPDEVERFRAAHLGGVVVKHLGLASIAEQGGRRALYTRLLTDDDFGNLSGVEHTMHQFQAWVDKAYDVRLTAVGTDLFAAAIRTADGASRIDFRANYGMLTYSTTAVPTNVATAVAAFMAQFQISFGAFDFAVDQTGAWWFLECNPGGQYAWIEQETGLPISAAIASLLERA